jgi:hypothetical protein
MLPACVTLGLYRPSHPSCTTNYLCCFTPIRHRHSSCSSARPALPTTYAASAPSDTATVPPAPAILHYQLPMLLHPPSAIASFLQLQPSCTNNYLRCFTPHPTPPSFLQLQPTCACMLLQTPSNIAIVPPAHPSCTTYLCCFQPLSDIAIVPPTHPSCTAYLCCFTLPSDTAIVPPAPPVLHYLYAA